ncbi:MAG: NADP-dependent malic enzyme [uncultured Rubrobacteraceae bacterium]|uniref:NADP-dependent malic enzyme n=1 Tax=uncultured Rubrobacteraceae bacterium TaxID=349277 RepID=A0A6J4PSB9_9ACTN|nr:MAG: NADP-dependent malic enzyme [uncultured Rubrobacteraceae bacterium]
MPLDYTYRVRQPHRTGQLATVAGAIAEGGGLIGDVTTINVGRDSSIREITLAVEDHGQAERIVDLLNDLEGVEVIWSRDRALLRHEGGKLVIGSTRPVRTVQDMRDVYTPGVARACVAISEDPSLAGDLTMIGRSVAICTNGTRVLGLGDIGPVPSMPVMEGKAVFYHQLANVSAMPILIDTKDVDEFVETVVRISPTFGGIHLEDISAPECFEIERRLIERLSKPVMHDDVHGTAVVTLAAALVACRHAGLTLEEEVVGQIGLGAAGYGIASLMADAGARRVIASDPNSLSHDRARQKGIEISDIETVMAEADVVVATTGKPGLIDPALVREGQVILALTNPYPEIEPDRAIEAGAAFAADGTSVNNVLGYPGIFRGALLSGAEEITLEMKLAAAGAIADLTRESELVPDALDPEVHERVATVVRDAAIEGGAAHMDKAPTGL